MPPQPQPLDEQIVMKTSKLELRAKGTADFLWRDVIADARARSLSPLAVVLSVGGADPSLAWEEEVLKVRQFMNRQATQDEILYVEALQLNENGARFLNKICVALQEGNEKLVTELIASMRAPVVAVLRPERESHAGVMKFLIYWFERLKCEVDFCCQELTDNRCIIYCTIHQR
jgi:hypothetical protein